MYQLLHLMVSEYSPNKIVKLKVNIARSKVTSRSNHDVAHPHPQQMSLPSINFLYLTVSEIQPSKFIVLLPGHKNQSPSQMPWVKTIPAQPLQAVGYKKRESIKRNNHNTNNIGFE